MMNANEIRARIESSPRLSPALKAELGQVLKGACDAGGSSVAPSSIMTPRLVAKCQAGEPLPPQLQGKYPEHLPPGVAETMRELMRDESGNETVLPGQLSLEALLQLLEMPAVLHIDVEPDVVKHP